MKRQAKFMSSLRVKAKLETTKGGKVSGARPSTCRKQEAEGGYGYLLKHE